jgi:hypothetical protein
MSMLPARPRRIILFILLLLLLPGIIKNYNMNIIVTPPISSSFANNIPHPLRIVVEPRSQIKKLLTENATPTHPHTHIHGYSHYQ